MTEEAINYGAFSEALNDKSDRDLRNITADADCVIEWQLPTEGNNYTWYRLYKSGWLEQGGWVPKNWSSSTYNGYTVSFPKAFANLGYMFTKTTSVDSTSATGAYANGAVFATNTKTLTSISTGTEQNSSGFLWEAKGMGVVE